MPTQPPPVHRSDLASILADIGQALDRARPVYGLNVQGLTFADAIDAMAHQHAELRRLYEARGAEIVRLTGRVEEMRSGGRGVFGP